eukprot:CAMPEP_0170617660 /NCGR_PEP_ID=MMETSP0224-20130122/26539_1 /TAXON_ID=285029 /ORGANISM="Togula jolla, Strain CCCM 725" /LENGTH=462 /DNA_ID=CAMNT_0010943573 /DNA_START=49 /DNA_END=1437 /DNA_ORIENTATION=+
MPHAGFGLGGGVPYQCPPFAENPGFLGLDAQSMAVFAQTFSRYLSQVAAAPVQTMAPNAGWPLLAPQWHSEVQVLSVTVEGIGNAYQLAEEDLRKVFCRYGNVQQVCVAEAGTTAEIRFELLGEAQAATADLNGRFLNSLGGTLRVTAAPVRLPTAGAVGALVPPPAAASAAAFQAAIASPSPAPMAMTTPQAMFAAATAPQAASQASTALASACAADASAEKDPAPGSQAGAAGPSEQRTPEKGFRKHTCRFLIGVDNDKDFQLVRRIIGTKGAHMKKIVKQTDAKLRLRGVGSGYLEGSSQKESSEPLQLCVSCMSSEGYHTAVALVEELLESVYQDYSAFCKEHGMQDTRSQPSVKQVQGDSPSSCDSPESAKKEGRRRGRRGRAGKNAENAADSLLSAPSEEEIILMIDARNEARRQCHFTEADRIRDALHKRGVALMDEPGARGKGSEVTTWRYWRD